MGLQPGRWTWPCVRTVTAVLTWALASGVAFGSTQPAASDAPSLQAIAVSFRLDPRLSGGTYGGEVWVSPATYTSALLSGTEALVEAKVQGVDAKGKPVSISPQWTAADPEMVTVTPGDGPTFRITVKRPGESRLTVAAQGASKDLVVKAKTVGQAMRVEILQVTAARPAEGAAKPSDSPVPTATQDASVFPDDNAKQSYALGVATGTRLRRDFPETRPDLVARGVEDALAGNKALVSDVEIRAALAKLGSEARTRQAEALKELADRNKRDGAEFLAANKANEGVVALESGLQYKVLKAGDGEKPTTADTVVCHYRGTLLDGREFDSSYKRGKPATLTLSRVIKGWGQALQLMPVGSKWQLFVPSDLAYGSKGARGMIGPNATLIFDVELLSATSAPTAAGGSTSSPELRAGDASLSATPQ